MLGASMEHGLHNARKPASRGGGGSGPARRHNKTQVEIEVMNLKRRLRQRQEELVAKDAAYMAMHPEYPEMVGDFLQAALAAKPKNVYAFARNHFDAIRATLCGNQIFNPTSMCAYSKSSTQALRLCFENSTRAIDSSKNQPNRLRFGRDREV